MGKENTKNPEVLSQQLSDHIESANAQFKDVGRKIKGLSDTVTTIKDNHLAHLGADITDIKISMTKNTTDTDWLKRFFWIVATGSIGALVASVLNLILK